VDTVDDKARCTHWSAFKEIDILTVTKDDLAFKAPFSIQALRNDYVHAFVTWFDISFSCCHKPVHFSTGPHARYTHWKHTIFYTKEAMMVEQGDAIDGEIMCAPNASNPRDLDIVIQYHHKGSVDETNETIQYKM
jgi:protein arginine N-methyltransferase 1